MLKRAVSFLLLIVCLYICWQIGQYAGQKYYFKNFQTLIKGNECVLPCWEGLVLGQSDVGALMTFLDENSSRTERVKCTKQVCSWTDKVLNAQIRIGNQDEVIQNIEFHGGHINRISLDQVIMTLGYPDYIDILIPRYRDYPRLLVFFIYEMEGIIIEAEDRTPYYSGTTCELDFPWEMKINNVFFVSPGDALAMWQQSYLGVYITPVFQEWQGETKVLLPRCGQLRD